MRNEKKLTTILTIAEKLVLVSPANNNECTSGSFIVVARLSYSHLLAPFSFYHIQCRKNAFVDEFLCQPAVLTIVKFNDPQRLLGCRCRIW